MKKFITYALVGVSGYLIGFYEYKYKIQKVMLERFIERAKEEKEKEKSE